MIDAKSITEEQIAEIQSWADEGATLADIQKKMAEEMSLSATYMEMRFLIEDIGVTLKPDEPREKLGPEPVADEQGPEEFSEIGEVKDIEEGDASAEAIPEGDVDDGTPVKADVTVDEVQRPGMIVNGKVAFDGGKTLSWYLDQMGRLGIDPGVDDEFRPSEAQLRVFQANLQVVLREKGFG